MKKIFCRSIATLAVILLPLTTNAEENTNTRQLSNVQIQYVETHPSAEETGTPRGAVRALFKKFEPTPEGQKAAEALTATDLTNQMAEKVTFDNGYLDMPSPLYKALISGFASYHVSSIPTFFSLVRPKDQVEQIKNELTNKFQPIPEKADYVLTLMPYRVSAQGADNAVLWIGVLLYDLKANQNIWTHYLSVPFGTERKGFNEADGVRIASLLINELAKKGWITAAKTTN